MVSTAAGPAGTFLAGHLATVEDDQAATWIGGGYAVATGPAASIQELGEQTLTVEEGDPFEEMLKPALVALADERGIDSSGTKAEIVARLRAPAGPAGEPGTGAGDAASEQPAEAPKTE